MFTMIRFGIFLLRLAILGGLVIAILTAPNWVGDVDLSKVGDVVKSGVEHATELIGKF